MDNEELIKQNKRAEIAFQALSELADIVEKAKSPEPTSHAHAIRRLSEIESVLKQAADNLDATIKSVCPARTEVDGWKCCLDAGHGGMCHETASGYEWPQ